MTNPWERQRTDDGQLEPNIWFHRFGYYLALGHDRHLLTAVNVFWAERGRKGRAKSVPKTWRKAFKAWNWKERAEAWDAEERRKRWVEDEQAREESRKQRRAMLGGFQVQIAKALKGMVTESVELKDLTKAMSTLMDELRKEYGDTPADRQYHMNIDLNSLTDDQLLRIENGESPASVLAT
jgi:hypothetical protein